MANIDEIYDMLSWEKDEQTQLKGIEEADKICSIGVFILPILPSSSKSIWENCAKVISKKTNEELKPYLCNLFTWFQDMNWPGASIIFDRLMLIPYNDLKLALAISISSAEKNNDIPWKSALMAFEKCFEKI